MHSGRSSRVIWGGIALALVVVISTTLQHHAIPTGFGGQGSAPAPGFGGQGDWWNPTSWVPDALGQAFRWIADGIIQSMHDLILPLFDLHLFTVTDPASTYTNPAVVAGWTTFVGVADALLVLIVIWAGYTIMAGGVFGPLYQQAQHLLPRIVLGALVVNLSEWFAHTLIDFNNALCTLPTQDLTGYLTLTQHQDGNLATAVFAILLGIASVLLLVQEFVRLALIDLLIVTAPLGLLCWILPETAGWSRLWSNTLVATVLVQFLQLVALSVGGALMQYGGTLGSSVGGILTLLIGVASLYTTFKIPGLIRSVSGTRQAGVASDIGGFAGDVVIASRLIGMVG